MAARRKTGYGTEMSSRITPHPRPARPVGLPYTVLLLLSLAVPASSSRAQEKTPAPPDVFHSDREGLSALFRKLETAFLNHDVETIEGLLSPRISEAARKGISRRLHREFESFKYTEFFLDESKTTVQEGPAIVGEAVIYRLLVPCCYRYQSRKEGIGSSVGVGDRAYRFWVEYIDGSWYVASNSDIFLQTGVFNPAGQIGKIIFAGFFLLMVVIFWLFGVWHCYKHTGSAFKALLVFAATPVGAAVYFFRLTLSPDDDGEGLNGRASR